MAGTISAELIRPIVDIASANVTAILPAGITILGMMLGVSLIPRIIYKFF